MTLKSVWDKKHDFGILLRRKNMAVVFYDEEREDFSNSFKMNKRSFPILSKTGKTFEYFLDGKSF